MSWTIYTLSCPIKQHIVYVGITSIKLEGRLKSHMRGEGSFEKIKYTKSLRPHKYIIEYLDKAANRSDALICERYWIHQIHAWGFDIMNKPISKRKVVSILFKSIYTNNHLSEISNAINCSFEDLENAKAGRLIKEDFEIKIKNFLTQNEHLKSLVFFKNARKKKVKKAPVQSKLN